MKYNRILLTKQGTFAHTEEQYLEIYIDSFECLEISDGWVFADMKNWMYF